MCDVAARLGGVYLIVDICVGHAVEEFDYLACRDGAANAVRVVVGSFDSRIDYTADAAVGVEQSSAAVAVIDISVEYYGFIRIVFAKLYAGRRHHKLRQKQADVFGIAYRIKPVAVIWQFFVKY